VILSSGYGVQGEVRKAMEMGCCAFIQKPYTLADLSNVVHEALHSLQENGTGN
jgi:DNA-binding NtrC family response regulator